MILKDEEIKQKVIGTKTDFKDSEWRFIRNGILRKIRMNMQI